MLNYKGADANVTWQQTLLTVNELLFAQQARDKAAAAADNQQPRSGRPDLSEVMCNNCNEKGHYQRSPVYPVQKKLKEDAEKYHSSQASGQSSSTESKSEGKQLLMHGTASDGFDDDEYSKPHLMFCQTSKVVNRMDQLADESEHRSAFEHNNAGRATAHMNWPSNLLGQASGQINEGWYLLESQSSCSVFTNRKYLKNVRIAPNGSGSVIGDLPGFGIIWYHPAGIANVLSLS